MQVIATVDEHFRLVLSEQSREAVDLRPGSEVLLEFVDTRRPSQAESERLEEAFRLIREGTPEFQRRLAEHGYKSIDEYMADIRPEW